MALREIADSKKINQMLDDIFTEEFMKTYTNFECFSAFRYSSAVFVSWNEASLIYVEERLDDFVKESTQFQSFDEMVKKAADMKYGES